MPKERLRRTRRTPARGARSPRQGERCGCSASSSSSTWFLKLAPGPGEGAEGPPERRTASGWSRAMAVETLSEIGYVISWRGILDPDNLLRQEGRGKQLGGGVAWAQLGGGMVVPGGTLGSMGVGAWMLHRLGMRWTASASGSSRSCSSTARSTAWPSCSSAWASRSGCSAARRTSRSRSCPRSSWSSDSRSRSSSRAAPSASPTGSRPSGPRSPTGDHDAGPAVASTKSMLRHRGSAKIVLGAIAYLGFDMAVLQGAFVAIDAHPVPTFAVVAMCYLIGGLVGSIPLPANLGAVTRHGRDADRVRRRTATTRSRPSCSTRRSGTSCR